MNAVFVVFQLLSKIKLQYINISIFTVIQLPVEILFCYVYVNFSVLLTLFMDSWIVKGGVGEC